MHHTLYQITEAQPQQWRVIAALPLFCVFFAFTVLSLDNNSSDDNVKANLFIKHFKVLTGSLSLNKDTSRALHNIWLNRPQSLLWLIAFWCFCLSFPVTVCERVCLCVCVHLIDRACVTSVDCEHSVKRFLSCLREMALCCEHLTSFNSAEIF